MSQSADQEVLLLATGNQGGTLLALTSSWQVLSEVPYPAPWNPRRPVHLCWRRDGQFAAVLSSDAEDDTPRLRIWTQGLSLDGVGRHEDNRDVVGMHVGGGRLSRSDSLGGDAQGPLAWKPSGTMLALAQSQPAHRRVQVILFERNGLRHGEFTLPGAKPGRVRVSHLAWGAGDVDGRNILAVVLTGQRAAVWATLQLWVRGNYHWYCKWETHVGSIEARARCMANDLAATESSDKTENRRPDTGRQGRGALRVDAKTVIGMVKRRDARAPEAQAADAPPAVAPGGGEEAQAVGEDDADNIDASTDGGDPTTHATITAVRWHPEKPTQLMVAVSRGIAQPELLWLDVQARPRVSLGSHCLAAVTDHCTVGLTPLQWALLPPPMSYAKVPLPHVPVALCFGPTAREEAEMDDAWIAALTSSGELCIADARCRRPRDRSPFQRRDTLRSGALVDAWGVKAEEAGTRIAGPSLWRHLQWVRATKNGAGELVSAEFVSVAHSLTVNEARFHDALVRWRVELDWEASSMTVSSLHVHPVTIAAGGIVGVWAPGDVACSWPTMLFLSGADGRVQCARWDSLLELADGSPVQPDEMVTFPEACPLLCLVPPPPVPHSAAETQLQQQRDGPYFTDPSSVSFKVNPRPLLVGQSPRSGRVWVEGTVVCPAAGSVAVHRPMGLLCFTTLGPQPNLAVASHRTLRLLLRAAALEADAPSAALAASAHWDAQCRRHVERGATLVAIGAEWTKPRVVLQMPRGNIEEVTPRVLTLAAVRRWLDQGAFRNALELCRTHRIDMNLLVDHNPRKFARECPDLVRAMDPRSSDRLDLLLAGVVNEDVTKTQYPPPPATMATVDDDVATTGENDQAKTSHWADVQDVLVWGPSEDWHLLPGLDDSKVNRVCSRVLHSLEEVYPTIFREPTNDLVRAGLTALTRTQPPQLERAMGILAAMRAQESSQQQEGHVSFERALAHLAPLSSADLLFRAALGRYDPDLAHAVATEAGWDPQEFSPFLRRLQRLQYAATVAERSVPSTADGVEATASSWRQARDGAVRRLRMAVDVRIGRWERVVLGLCGLLREELHEDVPASIAEEVERRASQEELEEWLHAEAGTSPPVASGADAEKSEIARAWEAVREVALRGADAEEGSLMRDPWMGMMRLTREHGLYYVVQRRFSASAFPRCHRAITLLWGRSLLHEACTIRKERLETLLSATDPTTDANSTASTARDPTIPFRQGMNLLHSLRRPPLRELADAAAHFPELASGWCLEWARRCRERPPALASRARALASDLIKLDDDRTEAIRAETRRKVLALARGEASANGPDGFAARLDEAVSGGAGRRIAARLLSDFADAVDEAVLALCGVAAGELESTARQWMMRDDSAMGGPSSAGLSGLAGLAGLPGDEDLSSSASSKARLVADGQWSEAVSLAQSRGRSDLIQDMVHALLGQAAEESMDGLQRQQTRWEQAVEALRDTRNRRATMDEVELWGVTVEGTRNEGAEAEGGRGGDAQSDVWSEASSVAGSVVSDISSVLSGDSFGSAFSTSSKQSGAFSSMSYLQMGGDIFLRRSDPAQLSAAQQKRMEVHQGEKKKKWASKKRRHKSHRRRIVPHSAEDETTKERSLVLLLLLPDDVSRAERLMESLTWMGIQRQSSQLCSALDSLVESMRAAELGAPKQQPPSGTRPDAAVAAVAQFRDWSASARLPSLPEEAEAAWEGEGAGREDNSCRLPEEIG